VRACECEDKAQWQGTRRGGVEKYLEIVRRCAQISGCQPLDLFGIFLKAFRIICHLFRGNELPTFRSFRVVTSVNRVIF
jgi:hypothetical protein